MKQIYWIYFSDGFDEDAVDEISENFSEATNWHEENKYRFFGTAERLQEFKRAVSTIEKIEKIV